MKKVLLASVLGLCTLLDAQVTGSKTIGTDYPTLAAAFAELNATGVGVGGATINIPAGYTETAPIGGFVLGNTMLNASLSATNPLVIKNRNIYFIAFIVLLFDGFGLSFWITSRRTSKNFIRTGIPRLHGG